MVSQGLLFSEPSVAETGVWCSLTEGIDPAKWARVCRYIGTRTREEFERVTDQIMSDNRCQRKQYHPAGLSLRTPLLSIGPSGIGGQFQQEHF